MNNELRQIVEEEIRIGQEVEELLESGLDNWDAASIAKFAKTIGITPDDKGFFDKCQKRMMGNKMSEKQSAGFCAKIIDKHKGTTTWRGKHED